MDEAPKRGPVESEIHELIRLKSLAAPSFLEPRVEGREFTVVEVANQALYGTVVLTEALLRLAREVDDLRAGR